MTAELPPLVIPPPLPSLVPELPRLAALLTCSICYELQTNSTSTPCLHSFCSLCIRKYLQFRPQCPTCHATVYEQNLRTDKTGEDVVLLFRPLVHSLKKLCDEATLLGQKENQNPSNSYRQPLSGVMASSTTPCNRESTTLPLSPVKTQSKTSLKSSPTLPLKIKEECSLLIPPTQPSSSASQPTRTPCPVCQVSIPDRTINLHVEKCLSTRKAPPPPLIQPTKKRAALPKLVYALLKDSELKKKCREFGLNPKGDRKGLIHRLQKYTLLYNTESQLDKPRSRMEIVMQVEREEKEEKTGKYSTPALLRFDRNTEGEVIEQKQRLYMKENKDTFADMIKKVKERNKNKTKKDILETETDSDGFNLIETVENIEEVSATVDQRGSIEDLTEVGLSEPVFDSPGPSRAIIVAPETNITSKSEVSQSTAKRSLSPTVPPISPPRKQPRSSSKAVYLTPKKSELEEMARSPMKSQNILDRLTASGEHLRKFPKIPCPVCNVGVTEKFLNIHLDKCLRSQEDPSPVITRTKPRKKSGKHLKPSVPKHLTRNVIEDNEDSEASLVLCFSDCEDEVFASQNVPARVKHSRGVVKPSIVEISDDPEFIEVVPDTPFFEQIETDSKEEDIGETASRDVLDDTTCPPSPLYEQYTDTISQNSYVQSQVAWSERDMFASGSEAEVTEEGKDDLDTSRNLLDIEDDMEIMMEAALSEHDENEAEEQAKIRTEKPKKRTVIQIIPTQRDDQSPENKDIPATQPKLPETLPEPEAPVARSTRRTTRLRSRNKLI
eukprot:GFUD01020177.1.p1 GENE.GFUD01020177.1~~GFUD01020177.1.p1  ORF type:complete len:780 (+),score=229.16 GFUD01020177.1:45-2384(+)